MCATNCGGAPPSPKVARDLGVGWSTVMTAVRAHGTPLVDDPAGTAGMTAPGVDEIAFLAANAEHHTLFVTGFVDLAARRLLDVVPGRSATSVTGWLDARSSAWLEGIGSVALDPHRGYATGSSPTSVTPRSWSITSFAAT